MRFAGQIVIVTGAGTGIGRAVALRFGREGAHVVVNDIHEDTASGVAEAIRADGGSALAAAADVTQRSDVDRMVATVMERFGQIDILVNNAGGSARSRSRPFHEADDAVWDWVLGVNLKGVMNCMRAVLGPMRDRRRGTIINMASIAATTASYAAADYAAAKGGVIALTRSVAQGVGPFGININCVSPGAIATEGVMPTAEKQEIFARKTCLGRVGSPEDVASLVAFLASDEANFITGQNYIIDGGRTLGS